MTERFSTFSDAYHALAFRLVEAPPVRTETWQGIRANLDTRELLMVGLDVSLQEIEDLDHWRRDVKPNLPWADDHFRERVGGEPLNPGEEWKNWPWGNSANKFKTDRFNHTYAERLWPKYARRTPDGRLPHGLHHVGPRKYPVADKRPRVGIEGYYGDLDDLVSLLLDQPHTRQAWVPLFFPEDTGSVNPGRKPCSLGWQFIVRDGQMSVYYPLRSCDLVRHLRDDWYLAIRLLLWVLDQCRLRATVEAGIEWDLVRPGGFHFHATSLHAFESDVPRLARELEGIVSCEGAG